MHRFFVRAPFAEVMQITGKDAHHITKVLRMQKGQKLQLVSSDQVTALMQVEQLTEDAVEVSLLERLTGGNEPSVQITLAQGLAKGDKMDFIVQKAVELGVSTIIPVALANCVVQLEGPKAQKKVERWQKIAEEAAKQSKREIIPQVLPVQKLPELLATTAQSDLRLLAYEVEDKQGLRTILQQSPEAQKVVLLIGPEGGIAPEEWTQATAAGWQSVSLGKRILRTETAGLATVAAILYETGDFGG